MLAVVYSDKSHYQFFLMWIVGGISPWEMNRFMSELDRQIDDTPGSLMV